MYKNGKLMMEYIDTHTIPILYFGINESIIERNVDVADDDFPIEMPDGKCQICFNNIMPVTNIAIKGSSVVFNSNVNDENAFDVQLLD